MNENTNKPSFEMSEEERRELEYLRAWKQNVLNVYKADPQDPMPFQLGLGLGRVINFIFRLRFLRMNQKTFNNTLARLKQKLRQWRVAKSSSAAWYHADLSNRISELEKLVLTILATQTRHNDDTQK